MGRRSLIALALACGSGVAQAQADAVNTLGNAACGLAGLQNYQYSLFHGCQSPPAFPGRQPGGVTVNPAELSMLLAARQLQVQQALLVEVQQLRRDLNANTVKLEETRKAFGDASATVQKAQEQWRDTALATLVDDVKKVPTVLAANALLHEALLPLVRTRLLDDPLFLQAVQDAARSRVTEPGR